MRVLGEVVRRLRRTVRFQVRRACTDNATNLSKSHCDEAAIGKRTNAKGDIDVLFQKIDCSVLQIELNVNIRKRRQEHRPQPVADACDRGRMGPRQKGLRAGLCTHRRRHARLRPRRPEFVLTQRGSVGAPSVGRDQRTARTMKQLGLQLRFELRHFPAHSRKRLFLLARRCRQAARFGNRQHNRHGLQTRSMDTSIFRKAASRFCQDIQHFRKGLFRANNGPDAEFKEPS